MTRIPLSFDVNQIIARRAVQNAKADLWRRGRKSASTLQPSAAEGRIGISSTVKYLLIQNKGVSPFVMWWVKGRTLPLACAQGDGPHFRNGAGVGTPGYVDIPHKGKVWRQTRWKHPGLKPKRFMESAISSAIRDSRSEIKAAVMKSLRGDQ